MFTIGLGLAVPKAVSRRLPTPTARVRVQVMSCGIYGGQSDTGAGFLRLFWFSQPILISPQASMYHPVLLP
jgi:hypothetical protein